MSEISSLGTAKRRKRKPLWRYGITFILGLICLVAVWAYFSGAQRGSTGLSWFPSGSGAAGWFAAPDDPSKQAIDSPSSHDFVSLEAQREAARMLARRYVGASLSADLDDLRILQSIVTQRVLSGEQTYELQALGVALGDVMVAELGFNWVVLRDKYGRSRALRYKLTENFLFPVTMISKRVEADLSFNVAELYEKAVAIVAEADKEIGRRVR